MFKSIFTDELGMDLEDVLPFLRKWGLSHCDLRSRILEKNFHELSDEQLAEIRSVLDKDGFSVACLESSLAKVHLPNEERQKAEMEKLERIISASKILGCKLVRCFFFWQPPKEEIGTLGNNPEALKMALDMFLPFAKRAKEAGLVLAFENCGCTPDECFAMLDALNVPEWGFAWDTHNTYEYEKNEIETDFEGYAKRRAARTKILHVKAQGLTVGKNVFPLDKVLLALQKAGFSGPLSVETHVEEEGLTRPEGCKRVLDAIDAAMPKPAPSPAKCQSIPEGIIRPWAHNPVRFAVVGLGMGHTRAMEIHKTSGLKLVKVCDLDEARARRTGEAAGVPWTLDFQDVLDDPNVEAVMVMNETGRHGQLACQALRAGKHVLVTKPMDMTTAACDEMIRLAQEKGLCLAVDHCRRLLPSILDLRQALKEGVFGRMLNASVSLRVLRTMQYFNANGGWRGTRELDGGVLSNQSVHHIDELLFCLGMPAKVSAHTWTQNHDIEMEDLACAVWVYASGLVVNFLATTCYPQSGWYYQMEMHGTEGGYVHREGGPGKEPVTQWLHKGQWADAAPVEAEHLWMNSMDNFAAHLRNGAPFLCPPSDARGAVAVINAMYESAYEKDGAWVEL